MKGRAYKRPGKMNGLEEAYSKELSRLQASGEILEWAYEPEKLRLADRTTYTPDFRVIALDGLIEFHECKAPHRFAAKGIMKLKIAAELHPYLFKLVYRTKGGWKITQV